jgi:hypothetical protein
LFLFALGEKRAPRPPLRLPLAAETVVNEAFARGSPADMLKRFKGIMSYEFSVRCCRRKKNG